MRTGPLDSELPLSLSAMPERLRQLARARAELRIAHRALADEPAPRAHLLDARERRAARGSARPAPMPSGSQTAFSSAWMP